MNFIQHWCFLNENMVKLVQKEGILCRVLQKILSKLDHV